MDATRFDAITKVFAGRRSRRKALAGAGSLAAATLAGGLGRTAAQEATPAAVSPSPDKKDQPVFLFLQAFRRGRVEPKGGADGRYSLTLEEGLGHTIYFSDRPDRIFGAAPTPQFLDGLGFPDDNPPNAALVIETEAGQTELAVVELFSPTYDEATRTATYEVAVLAEWERTEEAGFTETNADLSAFGDSFGSAHLFIDDCADAAPLNCYKECDGNPVGNLGTKGMCWSWDDWTCHPCDGDWDGSAMRCNAAFPDACQGRCFTYYWGYCGVP